MSRFNSDTVFNLNVKIIFEEASNTQKETYVRYVSEQLS